MKGLRVGSRSSGEWGVTDTYTSYTAYPCMIPFPHLCILMYFQKPKTRFFQFLESLMQENVRAPQQLGTYYQCSVLR